MEVPNQQKEDPILVILNENKIDPDKVCQNGQTAYEYLEGCIQGALDEIEE